jgi:hypothetical protein
MPEKFWFWFRTCLFSASDFRFQRHGLDRGNLPHVIFLYYCWRSLRESRPKSLLLLDIRYKRVPDLACNFFFIWTFAYLHWSILPPLNYRILTCGPFKNINIHVIMKTCFKVITMLLGKRFCRGQRGTASFPVSSLVAAWWWAVSRGLTRWYQDLVAQ